MEVGTKKMGTLPPTPPLPPLRSTVTDQGHTAPHRLSLQSHGTDSAGKLRTNILQLSSGLLGRLQGGPGHAIWGAY